MEKKKTSVQYSINDIVSNSEMIGKIDTSKWLNSANIVTPLFKRSSLAFTEDPSTKYSQSCLNKQTFAMESGLGL